MAMPQRGSKVDCFKVGDVVEVVWMAGDVAPWSRVQLGDRGVVANVILGKHNHAVQVKLLRNQENVWMYDDELIGL